MSFMKLRMVFAVWYVERFKSCRYHDNAYVTSRALHIVNTINASATFGLLEGFFKHQVCLAAGYCLHLCNESFMICRVFAWLKMKAVLLVRQCSTVQKHNSWQDLKLWEELSILEQPRWETRIIIFSNLDSTTPSRSVLPEFHSRSVVPSVFTCHGVY